MIRVLVAILMLPILLPVAALFLLAFCLEIPVRLGAYVFTGSMPGSIIIADIRGVVR